ncbi:hypothetical protein AAHB65_12185 [Bacillus toyonensis]
MEIESPHHNVRPEYNTRTGQVDGMGIIIILRREIKNREYKND